MAHQPITARHGHEVALKTNQSAGGHAILETRTTATIADHIEQFCFTHTELFHHAALRVVFKINTQVLIGLKLDAIFFFEHHTRTRYRHLVAFATHRLNQNRQM